MSENRYYEFRAIESPLTEEQMRELRNISTRAEITSTSFVNEYNWGDLKAAPEQLMEEYFDASLHITNYGAREVMLRLPLGKFDPEQAAPYVVDRSLDVWETDTHCIIRFEPLIEDLGREGWWEDKHLLPTIMQLREALVAGDLRALYLGWLIAALYDLVPRDEPEPPVPNGLGDLTEPLEALAVFICLDDIDLQVGAEASGDAAPPPTEDELREWLDELPDATRNDWLMQVVRGDDAMLGAAIRRRYAEQSSGASAASTTPSTRTAFDIYERADELRSAGWA